jgi:hypothetical protein
LYAGWQWTLLLRNVTERQSTVARMLGRGYSQRHTSSVTGVARSTIASWYKEPVFRAEVERVRELTDDSAPLGTLVDALSARRDDGIDWPSRLRAALALLELERSPQDELLDDEPSGWVT